MSECNTGQVAAYHDGELSPADIACVEAHLRSCPACAAELNALRRIARLLADQSGKPFTDREAANLHAAIDANIDRPIWRLGGTLAALAASIIVVCGAWLAEWPQRNPPAGTAPTAAVEPWERLATTLRPDPADLPGNDKSRLADARLADWMIQGVLKVESQ
jgi:anti-sigma factor RsiW